MKEYKLFIDGEWVPSSTGTVLDDINPATGEVYARIHQASDQDMERAIVAAYRAREAWGNTLANQRETIILKAADILEQRIPEVADVLMDEAGSVFGKAMFEASFVVNLLRSAAGECRRIVGETMPSDSPGVFSMSVRRPLGVIAGIAPFNFPFLLATKKVALALAAGNTFVLKPATYTPVTGLKIAEIFEAAGLPKGVLNVVPVQGSVLGNRFVADPRVRMITFTGSTEIGKQLAADAHHPRTGRQEPADRAARRRSRLCRAGCRLRDIPSSGPGMHGQLAPDRRSADLRCVLRQARRQGRWLPSGRPA
jgi:aldehyde dehydrogenase (NAD+)